MKMPSPTGLSSISDMIEYGKSLSISQETLAFPVKIQTGFYDYIIMNYETMYSEYLDQIQDYLVDYIMTDQEYIKYKYQPKLFCYEKYGVMDVAYLLLRINDMSSTLEFTKKKIKVFDERLFDILLEIQIMEDDKYKYCKSKL